MNYMFYEFRLYTPKSRSDGVWTPRSLIWNLPTNHYMGEKSAPCLSTLF